ncbi:MAG: hypothetical protein GC153_04295 [Alphaproteobacteria bacterium]|nr:hypothetical protein [Alphaproteobacteria bacterium]
MHNRRILISGLGVSGSTLAYWLRRYGFAPTVVELAPAPRRGGFMIDFWGVGFEVAERMRLIPEFREAGYVIDEARFVNGRNRKVAGISGELIRTVLGRRFLSLQRGDLAYAIYRQVEGRTPILFGDEIVDLSEQSDGVDVRFRHSAPGRYDLVIGADGLRSVVRRRAFGPDEAYEAPLGYWMASFTSREYPHRDEGAYTSYAEPGRQISRYSLRDGRTAFFFSWVDQGRPAPRRHDVAAERQAISQAFQGAGWEWPEIESRLHSAEDLYFEAACQIKAPAWSRGRVALVGDAAYCPSLLSGQGTAIAMAGAYLLAGELARSGGDYAAAFAQFESMFRPFVEKQQKSAAKFADRLVPKTALSLWLRNQSTRLLKVPLIGQSMMLAMIGDDFDLPNYREHECIID